MVVWRRQNCSECSEALAELGESLHHLLTGLEDLGVDSLPAEVESDMRRAMSLSPRPSPAFDTESIASSLASQVGSPAQFLSPAEEVAFSSLLQQMMAAGEPDCDPVIQHFIAGATEQMLGGEMWEQEVQWEDCEEAEM